MLPNRHALGGVEPHRISGRHAEGLVEDVQISDDLIAAELGRRVGVDREKPQGLFVACGLPPRLSPRQEESFRAGHSVDNGWLVAVQRQKVRLPGDAQPAEVSDVFADC